jgi:Lrp/AsnC family transcriptional regulator for asnA, asnC and gidA
MGSGKNQTMTEQVKIDEIDAKILKALIKDARTSFAEIARDCGISTNAIVKRFYRLKRTGVIVGTSLIIDMAEFGYKYYLSIGINVDEAEEIQFLESLRKMENVFDFQQQLGKFDVHAAAMAKSLEQINQIRDRIKRQKGVKSVKVTANIDKRVFFPENFLIQPTDACENGQNLPTNNK